MGFKLAEAYVEIKTNDAGLKTGLAAAKSSVLSGLRGINTAAAALGVGVGVGGLTAGLYKSVAAAADLNETVSKAQQVFGKSYGGVKRTADQLADTFGVVKKETLDAASAFGLITQASGLTKEASAGLSNQLAKLAVDASSFYNVPVADALARIQSGLTGEAEPMRRFGVLLNEDAVKAEALSLGLIKSAKDINDQAKVAARASLIIKGMATASGDLERTQDSLSNQMRKFQGDLKNFEADFGQSMIGPMTDAIKLARELSDVLGKVGGGAVGNGAGDMATGWVNALRQLVSNPLGTLGTGVMAWAGAPGAQKGLQAEADKRAGVNVGLGAGGGGMNPAVDARQKMLADEFRVREAFRAKGEADLQARMWQKFGKPGSVDLTQTGQDNPFSARDTFAASAAQSIQNNPFGMLGQAIEGQTAANGKEPFQAQTFEGGNDYHRSIQSSILEGDKNKQQEKVAANTGKALDKLDELIKEVREGLRKGAAAGAKFAPG